MSGLPFRYRTTIAEDDATIADPTTSPRRQVAARLLRIEKGILQGTVEAMPSLVHFACKLHVITVHLTLFLRVVDDQRFACAGALRQVLHLPGASDLVGVRSESSTSAWPSTTVKLA